MCLCLLPCGRPCLKLAILTEHKGILWVLPLGASPEFGRGGGKNFFQIWEFATCFHAHCIAFRIASGSILPRKIFLNGAICCVLGCILIRFCLLFIFKIYYFLYLKNKYFRYTLAIGYFSSRNF